MRYFTILILLIFSTTLFSQEDKLMLDSKEFIAKRMNIYEPNPIHKDMSDSITKIFHAMLKCFPNCKMDTSLYMKLFKDNVKTNFEDTQD